MKLEINNKQTIIFKNDSVGGWFGEININNKNFEFSFDNKEFIDWEDIKRRIIYFINYQKEIIEITEKGIIEYQKFLGWNLNYDFDLDCIELPTNEERKDDFIIPYRYDDKTGFDYVLWEIYIYDENGPKLREVKRE